MTSRKTRGESRAGAEEHEVSLVAVSGRHSAGQQAAWEGKVRGKQIGVSVEQRYQFPVHGVRHRPFRRKR